MIDHIVFIKFKEGTTAEQKEDMRKGLRSMVGKVPGVIDVEEGLAIPKSYNRGFEYSVIVKIDTEEHLNGYGGHEYHQEISKKYVRPIMEDMFGLDIVTFQKNE